jgi:release factor glutamine methyltransferase
MNANQTIKGLLREGEQGLGGARTARLDAEILLCAVMKTERSKLYSSPDQIIPHDRAVNYRTYIKQRSKGWPVAYLTGKKEFWSTELTVNENTLVPRPETECLVEIALEHIPPDAAWQIADIGTGCGAIAIALVIERPGCHITATDLCDKVLQVARSNVQKLGLDNIRFVQSDWFADVVDCYDLIISNPPYVRDDNELFQQGINHEPRLALAGGTDGLNALTLIISEAPRYLTQHGWLFVEHAWDQGEAVRTLLAGQQFTRIGTYRDYAGHERVSFGRITTGERRDQIKRIRDRKDPCGQDRQHLFLPAGKEYRLSRKRR